MKESVLQDKCIKVLKEKNIYYINKYGDGRSGKGCPDLITCINGKFVAFELKVDNNNMQADQVIHMRRIKKSGGLHYTPRTIEEFKKIINELEKGEKHN